MKEVIRNKQSFYSHMDDQNKKTISFINIISFDKSLEDVNNRDILVADFKTDINMISEGG